jgi:conjugal transfer mating pair stabilization protein TraG
MDPTIYTMGDPMIVREALFALAAIFNSTDWFNPANAFGMGGNLLAAALIGLLGILIAGISTQTMRVDYLLVAFVLFGIVFAVKVDVNVEDIQTGNAATVDDVPAGVAYVAALASSASYELAQDLSTALQRPASETSVLTADGFLNPLKVLLALRQLRLEALDPSLHRTMLAYYRYCVGKTLEQPASTFSMRDYTNAVDPMAYLTDPALVMNWLTVEYTEATPEGIARGCHTVAANINARMGALTAGLDDRVEIWSSRQLGSNAYNEGFTLADINTAVSSLFRAGLDAQTFMSRQMLSNLHNAGEAWRIAEYGSDKAQYVATLTEAMESHRVEVATEGSIFLQMMFPLMGFFQFLFFALPPIIVLVMLAAPAAAVRILGFYLLFGVWAYGWIPIAAVINHYIQIAIQNDIQFARDSLVGSGYTAILGFDSLYNVVATKLTIGANALASVPVILGAILTATPFAISNLAGRMAGGTKVNTSVAAPSLLSNGPVMQRAALASAAVGSVVSGGGSVLAASSLQRSAYGGVNWGSTLGKSVEAAETRASNARTQQSAASQRVFDTVRSVMTSSEIESGQKRRLETSMQRSLGTAYKDSVDAETRKRLSGSQAQAVQAAFGLAAFGTSAGMSTQSTSSFTTDQMNAYQQMLARTNDLRASVGESLVNTGELETEVGELLKKDVRAAHTAAKTAEVSEEYANTARATMKRGQQLGLSGNVDLTDLATHAYMRDGNAWQSLRGIVAGAGGASMLGEMDANANRIFAETAPMGIDGKRDKIMDNVDRIAASMQALDQMAARDPVAAQAYMQALRQVGGISVPLDAGELGQAATRANDAGAAVAGGAELRSGVEGQIGATGSAIGRAEAEVNAIGDGIAGDARQREDLQAQAGAWMSQAKAAFEKDEYGVRAAAANVDAAIEGAKREQSGAMSTKVVDWLRPGSGSDAEARAQLDAVPAGREREAVVAGAQAVAALGGAMRAQGDVTADPEKMYSDFVKMGWSPKAAAEAAYASAGVRTLGGSEALAAGTGISAATTLGAAGGQAAMAARGAESAARWLGLASRFGGPIAGAVAVGAGVALVSAADKKDAAAIDQQMRTGLMGAARSEMGETRFKEFEGYLKEMGGAQNAEQLANHLAAFETGTSEVTGNIGAYPSIDGDAAQRVEGWDRRIRGTD